MGSSCEQLSFPKHFLEKVLGKPVKSFRTRAGSNSGDNYMSVLYALAVQVTSENPEVLDSNNNVEIQEDVHLLCKCFPTGCDQQNFLINGNIFWKELCIYKQLIPELMKFQVRMGMTEIVKPNLPPFVTGTCVNFEKQKEIRKYKKNRNDYCPTDNYLMMVDIRKTWGYRMRDRFLGLDLAHASLAIEAIAKIHALSWAYKQKNNLQTLAAKFPFLHCDLELNRGVYDYMLNSNLTMLMKVLEESLGEESPEYQGTKKFQDQSGPISDIIFENKGTHPSDLEDYLRKSPKNMKEYEKPWRTLIHGDCWINNMLFRYNFCTGQPEEVTLVDLQMNREACPTTDLVYLIYTSTDSVFRRNHLHSMLKLYVDKFNWFCNLLNCETLPGFNLQSLTKRFHRAKLYGYCISVVSLPVMLRPPTCPSTFDTNPISSDAEKINLKQTADSPQRFLHPVSRESSFQSRIVGIAQDLYRDGVI